MWISKALNLKVSCNENRVDVREAIEDHRRIRNGHSTVEKNYTRHIYVGSTGFVCSVQIHEIIFRCEVHVIKPAGVILLSAC